MNVRIIPGTGRLIRTPSFLAFLTEPDPAIAGIVMAGADTPGSTIRQLATHVVGTGFEATPFMALAVEEGQLFVFGNVTVIGAGTEISGAESSTFIERTLARHEMEWVSVGIADDALRDTSLTIGCIPAAGFVWSTADVVPERPTTTGEAVPEQPQAVPEVEAGDDEPAPPEVASPAMPLPDSAAQVGSLAPSPVTSEDDWDPLADPESLDLAAIGAPEAVDAPTEETLEVVTDVVTDVDLAGAIAEPPTESPTVDDHPTSQQAITAAEAWTPPEVPTIGLGDAERDPSAEDTLIPEPGVFDPPERPASDRVAEQSIAIRLDFDDGQQADVIDGVLVGRFPHKNGLPEGFAGVVIRSEHVSRVHWRITVENGRGFVEDMDSQNGTFVQPQGRDEHAPVPSGQRRELVAGDRIHFGDRWALVG